MALVKTMSLTETDLSLIHTDETNQAAVEQRIRVLMNAASVIRHSEAPTLNIDEWGALVDFVKSNMSTGNLKNDLHKFWVELHASSTVLDHKWNVNAKHLAETLSALPAGAQWALFDIILLAKADIGRETNQDDYATIFTRYGANIA